jgi:hypothetical protein
MFRDVAKMTVGGGRLERELVLLASVRLRIPTVISRLA